MKAFAISGDIFVAVCLSAALPAFAQVTNSLPTLYLIGDLRTQLPALFGEGAEDTVARVKSDYRETIPDLHLAWSP